MSLKTNWDLQVDPTIYKSLKRVPHRDTERILTAIEKLAQNPYGGDIQKMKGEENVWRRRIGEYRLFYEVVTGQKLIHVFHVERRTSKTY